MAFPAGLNVVVIASLLLDSTWEDSAMNESPDKERKIPETANGSSTDRLGQWEKIAPHIIGIIIVLAIIIGMKMSGHRPAHVAIAMKEGAGFGLVGYAAGWILSKLAFFIVRRARKS